MGKYCFLDTFSLKTAFISVFQAEIMCPGGLLYASCGSPICVLWYYFKNDVPSLKLMGDYKVI